MKAWAANMSVFALIITIGGCQLDSRQQVLLVDKSQVALRSVQSRVFDTSDRALTLRTIIATLQDLGFTVDKVDQEIGIVSATKAGDYLMKMTISTRQRGYDQTAVRASIQHNLKAISDAAPYQQFFNSLEQAMFLETNKVH